jgi:hypothetical protein
MDIKIVFLNIDLNESVFVYQPRLHNAKKRRLKKYCALVEGPKEATWLKTLSIESGFLNDEPTEIWCNNISALKIVENSVFHARTKHIETHYHFVKK